MRLRNLICALKKSGKKEDSGYDGNRVLRYNPQHPGHIVLEEDVRSIQQGKIMMGEVSEYSQVCPEHEKIVFDVNKHFIGDYGFAALVKLLSVVESNDSSLELTGLTDDDRKMLKFDGLTNLLTDPEHAHQIYRRSHQADYSDKKY